MNKKIIVAILFCIRLAPMQFIAAAQVSYHEKQTYIPWAAFHALAAIINSPSYTGKYQDFVDCYNKHDIAYCIDAPIGIGDETLLHLALSKQEADIVAFLLVRGADIDKETWDDEGNGNVSTKLLKVVKESDISLAGFIASYGARSCVLPSGISLDKMNSEESAKYDVFIVAIDCCRLSMNYRWMWDVLSSGYECYDKRKKWYILQVEREVCDKLEDIKDLVKICVDYLEFSQAQIFNTTDMVFTFIEPNVDMQENYCDKTLS